MAIILYAQLTENRFLSFTHFPKDAHNTTQNGQGTLGIAAQNNEHLDAKPNEDCRTKGVFFT